MKKYTHTLVAMVLATAASAHASAETVVVVGMKNPTSTMSVEQVSQVFLGKSTSHTPIDQDESNSVRADFYKKATGKDASQVKAIWSKLVFTGKGTMPKEVASSADVKKAVNADPSAIGYIEKAALDGSVKAVLTIQ